MGPITSTVCPLHDSPFHPGLLLLGPGGDRGHSSHLRRGQRGRCGFALQRFLWSLRLTRRNCSRLPQLLHCLHLLSLVLPVPCALREIGGLGVDVRNYRVLLSNKESVFHVVPGLQAGVGDVGAAVGGELGGVLVVLQVGLLGARLLLLLLLCKSLQQLSLPGPSLLLPSQLLLLQDLLSQALLLLYLQTIQPSFFIFVWILQRKTQMNL